MLRSMKTVAACTALAVVAPAFAQDGFDYSYVEAGWAQTHLNPGLPDGSGFGANVSVALGSNFHFAGGYLDQDFSGLKAKAYDAGFGFNRSLTSGLDLVGRALYLNAKVESGSASVTDNGYGVSLLLRGRLLPRFELGGGLGYESLRNTGNTTDFNINGVYSFTDHVHAVGGFVFGDGAHTVELGLRYSFGK